jgi:hypothetical protein
VLVVVLALLARKAIDHDHDDETITARRGSS